MSSSETGNLTKNQKKRVKRKAKKAEAKEVQALDSGHQSEEPINERSLESSSATPDRASNLPTEMLASPHSTAPLLHCSCTDVGCI